MNSSYIDNKYFNYHEMEVGYPIMFSLKKDKSKQLKMTSSEPGKKMLSTMDENISYICNKLNHSDDLKIKKISFHNKKGYVIYLDTMADKKDIEETLIAPLKQSNKNKDLKDIITNVDLEITKDLGDVITELLQGGCAFLIENRQLIYILNLPQMSSRDPDEPTIERAVRGSHQGFVEGLNKNLNLIRLRIESQNLKFQYYKLGKEANKNVSIIYLNNIANPNLVKEVEKRLLSISLDSIFSPGYIEQTIEETPFSPFPQNLYTERPDRLEAHLMEGRVAIMVEGSTNAIILPVTFYSFFQSIDDFNDKVYAASVFRLLRIFSFWGALLLPPLYVAVVAFHFEIIPFEMISLVKNSISTVPFPPIIEALLMAVTIELIREAGIRLPSPIGETIGIVGGLIIGEAVVNAGLVSNVVVIVIALTAIMSFTSPSYEMGNTVRILSFPIMIMATMFGFVGIIISLMLILIHLSKLESLGVPYLAPVSPFHLEGMKDAFIRLPIWLINKRPEELNTQIKEREHMSREWEKSDQ